MVTLLPYPSMVERTLTPLLCKPKNNIRMLLCKNNNFNAFITLLKFASSTDILDPLFFKAQVINDDDFSVNADHITLFETRSTTISILKECQEWIEQNLDIIDGTNLSDNSLFLRLKKLLFTLGFNCSISEYIKTPSVDLAEKIKLFLINNVYAVKDVDIIVRNVIERVTCIAAQKIGNEFKEKNKLLEFHALLFNTLQSVRTSSSDHFLNTALLKELANKHSDYEVNVSLKSISPFRYIAKIYTIFSSCELLKGRVFGAITPHKPHNTRCLWNLSDKIILNSSTESFYVAINRILDADYTFSPFEMSHEATIQFQTKKLAETESPFDIEWHTYEIKEAVVWIKTDEDLRTCFIESFIDENGFQRYQRHEDNLVLSLNQMEFTYLAAQAVLVRFSKKEHS